MIDAWIFPGDLAVVDKWAKINNWDIVIAKIDWRYVIKFYERDRKWKIYLISANENSKKIYPEIELEIFGVVKGLIRKY